jgi:hypothetical protein
MKSQESACEWLQLSESELREVAGSSGQSRKEISLCRPFRWVSSDFGRSRTLTMKNSACTGQDVELYDIEDVLNPRLPRSTPSAYSRRGHNMMRAADTAGWRATAGRHHFATSIRATSHKHARIVWTNNGTGLDGVPYSCGFTLPLRATRSLDPMCAAPRSTECCTA